MIALYVPKLEELWFRKQLLSDPATMSYNRGYKLDTPTYHNDTGCIDFPEEDWEAWYARWVGTEPSAERSRFYAYLRKVETGEFLGEGNLYQTDSPGSYEMGIVLHSAQRGKGYSQEGIRLLLNYAFHEMGAREVTNCFERTRAAALKIHRDAGFRIAKEDNGLVYLTLAAGSSL